MTITVLKPSLITYNSLEAKYFTSLRCPCTNETIPYRKLISFSPVFHQICSSGFTTDDWIFTMISSIGNSDDYDWRQRAYRQFQILSDLCQLANKTIHAAIDRFLTQFFIVSSVMNENDFNQQIQTYIYQINQSTIYNFDLMRNIIQLIQQVNQFYEGGLQLHGIHSDRSARLVIYNSIAHIKLILYSITEINSGLVTCVCATNPNCQRLAVTTEPYQILNKLYFNNYNLSGWIESCLSYTSVFLSTLECLYIESDCFPLLMSFLAKAYTDTLSRPSSLFQIQPLVYNSTTSRYPPNTSILTIVKELMLEKWNPILSYEQFYNSCSPIYCTYSEKIRKENILGVIIILISIIGGIIVSLRITTPNLIYSILKFVAMFNKTSNQEEQIQHSCTERLRMIMRNLMKKLCMIVVDLNIFSIRDFTRNIDRTTAKYYGQWATRLCMLLYLSCLIVLVFYTIIQPHSSTEDFHRPSLIYYNNLSEIYGNKLKCSCSRIASTYKQFVNIQPEFHSICSSQFVSDQWRTDLVNGLLANLSVYKQNDYRRFLSAHLQYLQGLCRLSIQTVKNSIDEFLTSLLVNVDLLSSINFHGRLNILLEQSKANAPILFSHLLFFTQSITHGNAFISTYGTNFEYIIRDNDFTEKFAPTQPLIYDNGCSCGLSPNCTTQAIFIETNSLENISIQGMKIGCTPSESLLQSTLECFYNQSCLNIIQQYTNYSNSSLPLSINSSRFLQNTTIDILRQNLFIERWSTEMNYSLYYNQCSPLLCSYTSIEQFNLFYTFTLIFGLQGGLTIVLKWICPKLILIGFKIYYYYRRRRTISINPTGSSVETSNYQNRSLNITFQNNIISNNGSPIKVIFIITLLICFLISVIIFSIYYARRGKNHLTTTTISTNNNLYTTVNTTLLTTQESICQLKVKRQSIHKLCQTSDFGPYLITDLNNDKQVDLLFCCDDRRTINILFTNINNLFENVLLIPVDLPIRQINVADFNNDNRTDLIVLHNTRSISYINILYGNSDGMFQKNTTNLIVLSKTIADFSIIDLNNDNKLDIIIICRLDKYVYIYIVHDNGTFSLTTVMFTESRSDPRQLVITDFNNDSYMDIAIYNERSLHIHILFRNNDASFQLSKWLFTAFTVDQCRMIIADFNNDDQSDIVFSHSWIDTTFIFYQYKNGTFHRKEQILMNTDILFKSESLILHDLNNDNYLDIIVGSSLSEKIYYFQGNKYGNFQIQMIYPNELDHDRSDDFNNSICESIININLLNHTLYILLNPCRCST
ncbi:unnamed protein product [Adineta ricciae]|uniref:Uncharacterized protein n=1 Tax=Adineta ricciae TaxID=249248 RepID=A0A815VFJ3_ADIRI|nr:unnamed protein product [Adineta ricciae]CAF1563950.1 unnamed protein product [Adineta ricciae]